MKKIAELMTRDVEFTHPNATIQKAAQQMAEEDVGFLPVGADDPRSA